MQRTDSYEKTLMLGKIEGRRRRGQQRTRWLDDFSESTDMSLGRLWDLLMEREAWHAAVHGVTKNQTRLSNWAELNWTDTLETWKSIEVLHPGGAYSQRLSFGERQTWIWSQFLHHWVMTLDPSHSFSEPEFTPLSNRKFEWPAHCLHTVRVW